MEFVKYTGLSHRRVITADDFARAGVPDQAGVEWSFRNGFSVARDRFSDEAYERAIKDDPHLVLVGGDENAPRDLVTRQTPAQAAGEGRIDPMAAVTPGGPVSGGDASAVTVNDPITTVDPRTSNGEDAGTDVGPNADGTGTGAPTDVEAERVTPRKGRPVRDNPQA
jgi:hypothetical protein